MIKNEQEYQNTQTQLSKFEQALVQLESRVRVNDDVHPMLRKAQQEAMRYQIGELHRELEEYDALREGRLTVLELDSFGELPQALVQARIAAGLSQRQLAERLGLKERQIQQYESTDYASASIQRVQEVIQALGIKVCEEVVLPATGSAR